jgi:hypothetical protein
MAEGNAYRCRRSWTTNSDSCRGGLDRWSWIAVVLIGLFFLYGWYHDYRLMPKRRAKQMAEAEERRTSEEYVVQQQMSFEERLRKGVEIGLPDAVRGRSAYLYRYLMREWFSKLAAQSRYDERKLRKVRKDWLIYMEMLETSRTSNFLSLESRDEAAREKYGREAEEEKVQLAAIEDVFAEGIGPEAVEKLREIRAKEYDSFSDAGELAPDGYRYMNFGLRGVSNDPVPRKASQ